MRKLLLASVAMAALLAGPAIGNAQSASDRQPGMSSEQRAPKAGAHDGTGAKSSPSAQSEHRQTTGTSSSPSSPANDRAPKAGAGEGGRSAQGMDKEDKGGAEKKSGASEMNRDSGSQPGAGKSGAQKSPKNETTGASQDTQGDQKAGGRKSGKSDMNKDSTAQGAQKDQKSGAQPKASPQTQGTSKSTSGQSPATGQSQSGQSQSDQQTKSGATNAPQRGQNPNASQSNTQTNTTNQNNQAGTSTTKSSTNTSASVTQEQQTKFNQVIEKQKVQSVTNVNFSVSVGTSVPRNVHVHEVPRDIVTIYPEYRGKQFTVVRDEIVIIEPSTRKIVTVIPRSGRTTTGTTTSTTSRSTSSKLNLAPEKRRMIRETVIKEQSAPRCSDIQVTVGEEVPASLSLRPFPDVIVRDVPDIRSYEFCIKDNDVVVIDSTEHRIVEVLD
jgi:uncharacterized protein DUF1236